MSTQLFPDFVHAELSELWDAEHEVARILPHVILNITRPRTRLLVRKRSVQAALHLDRLHELLKSFDYQAESRCCTRVRQWVADYTRLCADPLNDAESVATTHLLKIDDYSIAACMFAARCAQAIADRATAETLERIRAEKHQSRTALADAIQSLRSSARASQSSSLRHRCWPARSEFDGDNPSPVLTNPRHSPTRVPASFRDFG